MSSAGASVPSATPSTPNGTTSTRLRTKFKPASAMLTRSNCRSHPHITMMRFEQLLVISVV